MVKFSAGYLEHRQAYLVGLGLEEGNLVLLQRGKPIPVRSEELSIPAPGFDLVLFYGADQDGVEHALATILAGRVPAEGPPITVLHVHRKFYVAMANAPAAGRVLYLVGLDDTSFWHLRGHTTLNFRTRRQEGEVTPLELLLFWGPTAEHMEEQFYAAGLVDRETKVRRA